jgi:hypothetical protein
MASTASNSSDGYSAATAPASVTAPDSGHSISITVGTLAVAILVIAGVVLIRSLAKKDGQQDTAGTSVPLASGSPTPAAAKQPRSPVQMVPVVFAAVVRAAHARTAAGTPEQAAELFQGAAMRWAGSAAEWSQRATEMGLPQLPSWSPEGDDRVIATYRAELPWDEIPNNFIGIQRSLNNLASNGSLKSGALYGRPLGIDPSRFGFREF